MDWGDTTKNAGDGVWPSSAREREEEWRRRHKW
jgi:hypothetical protein